MVNYGRDSRGFMMLPWFSDQYILEIPVHKLDAEAGCIETFSTLSVPDSNIATVSIINEGKVKSEVFQFLVFQYQ
jgi:hypothetical protein